MTDKKLTFPPVHELLIQTPRTVHDDLSLEGHTDQVKVWFSPYRRLADYESIFTTLDRAQVTAMRDWMTAWLEATGE